MNMMNVHNKIKDLINDKNIAVVGIDVFDYVKYMSEYARNVAGFEHNIDSYTDKSDKHGNLTIFKRNILKSFDFTGVDIILAANIFERLSLDEQDIVIDNIHKSLKPSGLLITLSNSAYNDINRNNKKWICTDTYKFNKINNVFLIIYRRFDDDE